MLITALVLTTSLCLLLGWAYYRLFAKHYYSEARRKEQELNLMIENEEQAKYLRGILQVLNTDVGGIRKRINESAEIVDAIATHAPDLFDQCKGLAFWLHANDQFLVDLQAAAGEGIDRPHDRQPGGTLLAPFLGEFGNRFKSARVTQVN